MQAYKRVEVVFFTSFFRPISKLCHDLLYCFGFHGNSVLLRTAANATQKEQEREICEYRQMVNQPAAIAQY